MISFCGFSSAGTSLFAPSNASAVTSNCMTLSVWSKSREFGTPRLRSWILVPTGTVVKSMTTS